MDIEIEIEGATPLLCNRFNEAAQEAASSGNRSSAAAGDKGTPREQAERKLYIGHDGVPMIPQPNLLRCLVDGGRFHKIGRAQVTTKESSMLYACLDIHGTEIIIHHREPWRVDTRAVVVPSTKGRILTHRPLFDDWKLAFTVALDKDLLAVSLLRKIVDDAGKRVGLGDYRPARKGPYGRFNVTKWNVVEVPLEEVQKVAA